MNQTIDGAASRVWQNRVLYKFLTAFLLLGSLAGCATSGNPRDPLEGYNRAMFSFNDAVDKVALKPAATVYQAVTPTVVQTGVGNFFGNLSDIWTAVNNLLQGKLADAMSDVTRVALNSSFGVVGLFDIASEAGLPKHKEDFGQTLGKWGMDAGPYLVLPVLGPSTLRDTLALPLDIKADPWQYKHHNRQRVVGSVLRVIDQRASLLEAGNLMDQAALDRYEFVRDGFLQRRQNAVYDGDIPKDKAALEPDAPELAWANHDVLLEVSLDAAPTNLLASQLVLDLQAYLLLPNSPMAGLPGIVSAANQQHAAIKLNAEK